MITLVKSNANTAKEPRSLVEGLIPKIDVARMLGVTPQCLRAWERKGRGPVPTRIGGRVYYRREPLLDWLREQERHRSDVPH